MVEWKTNDRRGDENNRLLEGRTVSFFRGSDMNDLSDFQPITCLPTIAKRATLAINKRMRRWLLGSVKSSILENELLGSGSPRDARRPCLKIWPRI